MQPVHLIKITQMQPNADQPPFKIHVSFLYSIV